MAVRQVLQEMSGFDPPFRAGDDVDLCEAAGQGLHGGFPAALVVWLSPEYGGCVS